MLTRFSGISYALMRVVVGFLFACHGEQKLFGVLGGQIEIHDPEGLTAGVIEFTAGIAVSLGLFSSIAAFIASGDGVLRDSSGGCGWNASQPAPPRPNTSPDNSRAPTGRPA